MEKAHREHEAASRAQGLVEALHILDRRWPFRWCRDYDFGDNPQKPKPENPAQGESDDRKRERDDR